MRKQLSYYQQKRLNINIICNLDNQKICNFIKQSLKQAQLTQTTQKMEMFKIQKHEVIFKATCKITSPLSASSQLYYCVSQNGDVYKISSQNSSSADHKQSQVLFTILGCPSAIQNYEISRGFVIADLAHQSIFLRDDSEVQQITNLITQFNDKAFLGPSSLAINQAHSCMFFTDSGAFGETSLQNKHGSLFAYKFQQKTLRSLIYRQLAYPCGVILSPDEKFLLVCELGQNRIIKVILDENMNGNYTIFHQFSGRAGPSSICCYNQYYFVSLFEFAELDNTGLIAVLNLDGDLIQKVSLPTGSQISSIRFVPPGLDTNTHMICLVAEGNRLHQIQFRGDKLDNISEQQGPIDNTSGVHKS